MCSLRLVEDSAGSSEEFEKRLSFWLEAGIWGQGELLPEDQELAELFDFPDLVGIRRVLNGLSERGALVSCSFSGQLLIGLAAAQTSMVAASSADEIPAAHRAVLEARDALFVQGAGLAANRAAESEVRELRQVVDDAAAGRRRLPDGWLFARSVIVASGNATLLRVYDQLMAASGELPEANLSFGVDEAWYRFVCRELVAAISMGWPQAAARIAARIF
ncbi:FCD domain-containing protein [Psychromicrobium xiongbiense]|uniref:FCD domain-containing protein n=1 Tax=Psychromicrobium xiongbiense TaxID=3051184 RepID=UPI002552DAA9|nr:FCD domain-containing protein [Psychromicrobium sp. YIM S02556]